MSASVHSAHSAHSCLFAARARDRPWLASLPCHHVSGCMCLQIYFWAHRGSMEFTGACFDATRVVISKHPSMEVITMIILFFQAAWVMVFSMARLGMQVRGGVPGERLFAPFPGRFGRPFHFMSFILLLLLLLAGAHEQQL